MTMSREALKHLREGGRVRYVEGVEVLLPPAPSAPDLTPSLVNPFWPDRAGQLMAENRDLRATLYRRNCAIGFYQALSVLAVMGCVLLALGV